MILLFLIPLWTIVIGRFFEFEHFFPPIANWLDHYNDHGCLATVLHIRSRRTSQNQRKCMETQQSFILFSTVVFTKASCNDQTPFAAVSSIKEKGQIKVSDVANRKRKTLFCNVVVYLTHIQQRGFVCFNCHAVYGTKSPENRWLITANAVLIWQQQQLAENIPLCCDLYCPYNSGYFCLLLKGAKVLH